MPPGCRSLRRRAIAASALTVLIAAAGMSGATAAPAVDPRSGDYRGTIAIGSDSDAGSVEIGVHSDTFSRVQVWADATLLDAAGSAAGCTMGKTIDSKGYSRRGAVASDGSFEIQFKKTGAGAAEHSTVTDVLRFVGSFRSSVDVRTTISRTVTTTTVVTEPPAEGSSEPVTRTDVVECISKKVSAKALHPAGVMWPFPAGPRVVDCKKLKCVALTFDDGPGSQTPTLLGTLRDYRARATFFVVGERAAARPKALRAIDAAGHEIGSHSWSHPSLTGLANSDIRRQMSRTADAIEKVTGDRPQLMRPPYGALNNRVENLLGDIGYPMVLWSVDPLDWRDRSATTVANRVLGQVEPGSIVLLHDIHASTVAAVPRILKELKRRGYVFVTVSELYGRSLTDGRVYHSAER